LALAIDFQQSTLPATPKAFDIVPKAIFVSNKEFWAVWFDYQSLIQAN
jgi:hypothetical protein